MACVWCHLCVNVPWMQAANLQNHSKNGAKTEKRAKILIVAFCGAVLVTPVQMDTWM